MMTNRDRIDRGMAHVASGLAPFVDEQMTVVFPAGKDWAAALVERSPSRYQPDRRYSQSDPRFLLSVITSEWRVFRDRLSRVEQGFAVELKDAGNRWAHGESFSDEDTFRILDTMERLLTAIGATGQAAQVGALRHDIGKEPSRTAEAAPRDPGRELGSVPVARPASLGGFWSAVGYGDVLRAIEEYDRLGQDEFLATYGFGPARAYLLIHEGLSYDSKAILGVAYRLSTGVPLKASQFSGGVHGAAGVLRQLGFEVHSTRAAAGPPARNEATSAPVTPRSPLPAPGPAQDGIRILETTDRLRCLLVVTCSGRKQPGGEPSTPASATDSPSDLDEARRRVLATAHADTSRLLPAWQRYTGAFYQHAQPALADAVAAGHVVIISGGYGVAHADELIGCYDRALNLADWPSGLLEATLIREARRQGAGTVAAFASASTGYARLLRRTPWQQAGIHAHLVTITGVTSGALVEVQASWTSLPRFLDRPAGQLSTRHHRPATRVGRHTRCAARVHLG
jgi:hypothetical protein